MMYLTLDDIKYADNSDNKYYFMVDDMGVCLNLVQYYDMTIASELEVHPPMYEHVYITPADLIKMLPYEQYIKDLLCGHTVALYIREKKLK